MSTEEKPRQWPDGQPVTPWADPWHDVAGDVRDVVRQIRDGASPADLFDAPPPCADHGLLACPRCLA